MEARFFSFASKIRISDVIRMHFLHRLHIIPCLVLAFCSTLYAGDKPPYAIREGDIVFSGSTFGQGAAIIAATGSPYTHCGIVFEKNGRLMVLEAVQPVGVTTLKNFISRGRPENFTARRLKIAITPAAYRKGRAWGVAQIGRNYDTLFQWDNKNLYCSELVWKIYQNAGIELCKPRLFKDYNLQRPEMKAVIVKRYGSMDRLPMNEKVVAPSDLAASPLLEEVPRKDS